VTALREIAPTDGSRNGWHYKSYLRIGRAKLPNRRTGGFEHYGLYGARRTTAGAWELFTQWEGTEDARGDVLGKTLLQSSMDAGAYLWSPADSFADIRFF
jgi:hypothetical protein